VKGEGCGIVVLKRLEDAERDGDRIYAVIKSCSQNNRGAARSLADVKPEALTDVIRTCHQRSNVAAESVDYIEVDGYATKWADAIEYEAIKRVFGESSARAGKHCGLGSLKGNIGHLEPASGIASLIKVALSLHHQQFPATISCDTVNEYIDVSEQDHPLYIVAENTPFSALARDPAAPVRAGVNSFADSGVNLHILLEEYREAGLSSARQGTDGDSRVEPHLVVLSARSEDRLRAQAERLLQFVEQDPEPSTMPGREGRGRLRDLAYTLQVGREAMEWRLAVRGQSAVELASRLQAFLQGRRDVDGLDVGRAPRDAGASAPAPVDAGALETLDRWMDGRDWERLSRWWVQGGQVDWRRLYGHDQPRRMSAPTYPFLARRYWAKPAEARSEAVSPEPSVSFESVGRRAEARPSESETHALKERMKSVFSALFGIAAAEIEEDRPFFELGMNSVNVAEFVEALRKQLGISLEVSDVFNYPTFQALAAYTQPDVAVETSGGRVHGPSIDLSRLVSQVGTDQLDVENALELLSTGEWTPS
jgi:polyketide synthase PksN